ncbi:MAG TPA: phosphoribosylformylglycinamidine synthase, partial [Clostridiales bacterium]|nr:phosphoribosylformylglycinamidine synthase [Clostridiales bacterium]
MVRRIYAEKKPGFNVEAMAVFNDLKENLRISGLTGVRVVNRYDVQGISAEEMEGALHSIFSEPPVDHVWLEDFAIPENSRVFTVEYLPGQYDQRADSAAQCLQILTCGERPQVRSARCYLLSGDLTEQEFAAVKSYLINPVESREAAWGKPDTLFLEAESPPMVDTAVGFIQLDEKGILDFARDMGLAMSAKDLEFVRSYFAAEEKRDPTLTEIRVIDTYWSDHCRHTTFLTELEEVGFEDGAMNNPARKAWQEYMKARNEVHGSKVEIPPACLMDIATIGAKQLKKAGVLDGLDISDENNACSIEVDAEVEDPDTGEVHKQKWLVMFKNETHNHPTEIEPFGGA